MNFSLGRTEAQKAASRANGKRGGAPRKPKHAPCPNKAIKITFKGKTLTVREWSEEIGVSRRAILRRKKDGMPTEMILFSGKFNPNFSRGGCRSPFQKLSEQDVERIRQLLGRGIHQRAIAMMYSVSHGLVSHIAKGRKWIEWKRWVSSASNQEVQKFFQMHALASIISETQTEPKK